MEAVGAKTATFPTSTMSQRLIDLPLEVQSNILEFLFVGKRIAPVQRKPPQKGRKKSKKSAAMHESHPPLISVLLVSKQFIDRRFVIAAMLKTAIVVLKRLYFDKIDDFLDEPQRCLIKRIDLDFFVTKGRHKYLPTSLPAFTEIVEKFPGVQEINLNLQRQGWAHVSNRSAPNLRQYEEDFASLPPPASSEVQLYPCGSSECEALPTKSDPSSTSSLSSHDLLERFQQSAQTWHPDRHSIIDGRFGHLGICRCGVFLVRVYTASY